MSNAEGKQQVTASVPCRLCGSTNGRRLFNVNHFAICRCTACGLMQMAHRPTAEEIASIYSTAYFKSARYGMDPAAVREQRRRMTLLREQGIAPGMRVLDVGCAMGDFVIAAGEDFEMWGLDLSSHAIEVARDRVTASRERLCSGDFGDLPVPSSYFDAITMWDVVEHLDDPVATIRTASTFLRPGGRLFVSTPNVGAIVARIMGRRWAFMTPPEHIGFFSRGTLKHLLSASGFEETSWKSQGKWINLGFLVYKLGRVFPDVVPRSLGERLLSSRIGGLLLYVPTGDVQYASARLSPDLHGTAPVSKEIRNV